MNSAETGEWPGLDPGSIVPGCLPLARAHVLPARDYFEKAFGAVRREGRHGITESSFSVLVRVLLLESDRLAIMPAHQLRHEVKRGEIAVLPIAMPDSARPIGVTVRAGWRPTATQEAFLRHLRAACEMDEF